MKTTGKVVVKARSRLGLTYGVVSLIQCIDPEIDMPWTAYPAMVKKRRVSAFWR